MHDGYARRPLLFQILSYVKTCVTKLDVLLRAGKVEILAILQCLKGTWKLLTA